MFCFLYQYLLDHKVFEPMIIDDVIFFENKPIYDITTFSEYLVQHVSNIVLVYYINVANIYLEQDYLMHRPMCLNFLKYVDIQYNQIVVPRDEPSKII